MLNLWLRMLSLRPKYIDAVAKNARRDIENARCNAKNAKFETRIIKLEQDSSQSQSNSSSKNIPDSIVANEVRKRDEKLAKMEFISPKKALRFKIELFTCALPKDGLLSDEKNSELLHSDLSSGSNKKNSELSYTSNTLAFNTFLKSGINILPASCPPILRTNSTHDYALLFLQKTLD
ncbi:hypothetical protein GLOIN_2v1769775 [Rhizophagus irregularis DAOM 181602=DAOM 197198]|uniref:Uncharacterized protein n=1 Tax=Rhizophagus irregularis (strain DAOM 181602 / DAOM 197198 / MUCL 43194) TaxID=747089 RepID=A0A2P4QDP9_RHIID|nr:hypothetical protein GLOIN_2v1769775 [Rhizophagus irregularis DAOM 181602=DAOM 197198]POG75747.1 hypothetical protein GLOIN_2v1769775 [Rhizophagus irregularis DAOM 181602=DAOM 197198]|eukprot:XP_025182613.1 hypothetical protein GLOIN_2v1769775 [Rhizophagus irregularis DAOM 181602=DAOM 197198]